MIRLSPDKKKEIEKLLNEIPSNMFDQLVSIGRLIMDCQDAGGDAAGGAGAADEDDALDDDVGVGVEFEENEEEEEESDLDMYRMMRMIWQMGMAQGLCRCGIDDDDEGGSK